MYVEGGEQKSFFQLSSFINDSNGKIVAKIMYH